MQHKHYFMKFKPLQQQKSMMQHEDHLKYNNQFYLRHCFEAILQNAKLPNSQHKVSLYTYNI